MSRATRAASTEASVNAGRMIDDSPARPDRGNQWYFWAKIPCRIDPPT
jgi:hypothetical protein